MPSATIVQCIATDCSGCTLSALQSFQIRKPVIELSTPLILIDCPNDLGFYNGETYVDSPDSPTEVDWSTLEVSLQTLENWIVSVTPYESNGLIRIAKTGAPSTGSFNFVVKVKDVYGVQTELVGSVLISDCSSRVGNIPALALLPTATNVPSTALTGDIIEIPVTAKVASLVSPNWSTAQVLASPAYASPSIAFATRVDGEQVINYEYAGVDDLFAWTVDDEDGNTLPPTTVSIVGLPAAPVANTDNVAMVIGETETFNVLSNDTSAAGLNPSTLQIVTQSTSGGTAVANSNGTLTFVSDITDTGGTLVQYTVRDIYGQVSNTGSVVITRISAGNGSEADLCAKAAESVTINLFDLLTGTRIVNTTGSWTNLNTVTPTPAAPALYNDDVTFTQGTHASGTHTYRYTVTSGSASDFQDVEVNFITYTVPSNNECASATVLSFSGRGDNRTLSEQNLNATCPGFAAATLSAPAIPSSWGLFSYTSDVWYAVTATPYYDTISMSYVDYPILVRVNGAPYGVEEGIYAPAIAIYDGTCGSLTERSSNVADVTSQTITGQVTITGNVAKTFYIRVSSVTGYEGKYIVNTVA